MRIAIIALGSRGDVQPYLALAKGLQQEGHRVRVVTHPDFAALAAAHNLQLSPVRGSVQQAAESPEMRALLEKGNFLAITRRTAQEARRVALDWAQDGLAACRDMDLLIAGIGGLFLAASLAQKLDLPLLQAHLVPFSPTSAFPSVLLPPSAPRLGAAFNRVSHRLTRQVMWHAFRAADGVARRQVLEIPAAPFWGPFGAPQMDGLPILYGFSPAVLARPADWGPQTHVTGYWFLEEEAEWRPPPALQKFLEQGPPPVYVGFGSMTNRKPEDTTELILQAVARAGARAVLLSGWSGLQRKNPPENVYFGDSLPHTWLFRHMAAVVHHGGAGTTAAGLRAGAPSVIVPFFGDQFFWGERVAQLGAGPAPLPRKRLTVERLAQAIEEALLDVQMRRRAAETGAAIRAENGVARAVEVVEKLSL